MFREQVIESAQVEVYHHEEKADKLNLLTLNVIVELHEIGFIELQNNLAGE